MNSTVIQGLALAVMLGGMAAGGRVLDPLLEKTEEHGLRYTDVSVEGAPPFVAIGTAIGALRGLIVDYLWIKVHMMKEKGLYYEVMADADLITKLQPRFAAVWAFHGHNMAYNISVACQTVEERWEWVNAGIRLVRNEGLRYNPNDLVLHRELAFWFAHKIEGYSDDAHLFYKREFCREWHAVLGPPPESWEDRIAWIRAIADAPATLEEAERRTPGVKALITRIDAAMTPFGEQQRFEPTRRFLEVYGNWRAVKEQSEAAKIRGIERELRANNALFNAFDAIAADPAVRAQWETLILFVRKRVLTGEYNMDPRLMYEFTQELGPIDWRHGSAHALYWSRRGSMLGEARVANVDDVYKMLNNDRQQMQAMQDLARYGRITFDQFSTELPARFPDPRWVDTIERMFVHYYTKHYGTRGAGGETFIDFLKNFMGGAIREAYRSGEHERAQRLLDRLAERFGDANPYFRVPLANFVRDQVRDQYAFQPWLAPSEAVMSLRYAFREGIGRDRPEVYEDAVQFVDLVIKYFRGNEYNDYVNRFGEGRMKDLLKQLDEVKPVALIQLLTDPTVSIREKATIWANVDKQEPQLRVKVYDRIEGPLRNQFGNHELSQRHGFEEFFPEPPGMAAYRTLLAAQQAEAEKKRQEEKKRAEFERK